MPDASGRFKGIAVPRVPWHEDPEETEAEAWKREALDRYLTVRPGDVDNPEEDE